MGPCGPWYVLEGLGSGPSCLCQANPESGTVGISQSQGVFLHFCWGVSCSRCLGGERKWVLEGDGLQDWGNKPTWTPGVLYCYHLGLCATGDWLEHLGLCATEVWLGPSGPSCTGVWTGLHVILVGRRWDIKTWSRALIQNNATADSSFVPTLSGVFSWLWFWVCTSVPFRVALFWILKRAHCWILTDWSKYSFYPMSKK